MPHPDHLAIEYRGGRSDSALCRIDEDAIQLLRARLDVHVRVFFDGDNGHTQ
jgi:hypothetical protein